MDYYLFTDPGRIECWVSWLADPKRTLYPKSGHLSIIDRA